MFTPHHILTLARTCAIALVCVCVWMCLCAGSSSSALATTLTSTSDFPSTAGIHNFSYATPATILPIASANPASGTTISRIDIYAGSTLISTSNGGTLNTTWDTLVPGSQTLTARAVDSNGGVNTASVTINIIGAANETITFIHNDLAGSPMAATDINGAIVWKEDYTPYGERKQNEAASSNQHQWFGGKVQDSETGLSYFGARYYDPVVGRFMGVDAVGFNPGNLQSFNRYAYANNNPYKYVDPDGNTSLALCAGGPPGCAVGIGLAVLTLGYSIIPAEDQQRINQAVGAGFRSAVDALRGSADGYLISVGPGPVVSNSDGSDKPSLVDNKGKEHILNGDKTGGGHRAGTGIKGKSEFPSNWSDEKILGEISDVATDPASKQKPSGTRTISTGTRDGVEIKTVSEPGRIVTGYPINTPKNE